MRRPFLFQHPYVSDISILLFSISVHALLPSPHLRDISWFSMSQGISPKLMQPNWDFRQTRKYPRLVGEIGSFKIDKGWEKQNLSEFLPKQNSTFFAHHL